MTLPVAVTDLRFDRPGFQLGPLSFDVAAGGRLAIVGPSGSGKTTLLRCLAGLQRPSGGAIRIGTQVDASAQVNVPPDRRGLGLVFQDGALWSHMTALQHLTFAAPGLSRDDAQELLAQVGLGPLAARKPGSLSGGEAQRLGLVRALATAPAVLLLDEPLRSVDVHQRDSLVLLLRQLTDQRGLTTILVTHDRDEALSLATDLVVLHEGQLVEHGPALALLQRPATAFTAAFLLGAACVPVAPASGGRVATPFGEFDRPTGSDGDLRLVLLPGSTTASALPVAAADRTPHGRVLAALPAGPGFRLQIAFGDQLVTASATTALPIGSQAALALAEPPRLLPWHRRTTPGNAATAGPART